MPWRRWRSWNRTERAKSDSHESMNLLDSTGWRRLPPRANPNLSVSWKENALADARPITAARFWSKVDVSPDNSACWNWRGSADRYGYGRFRTPSPARNIVKAHRLAYELFYGVDLGDRHALHSCDNPRCCNPHHIRPGSHAENMTDMRSKGRRAGVGGAAGERNPNARLTAADVAEIRRRIAMGEPGRAIAKDFPVTESAISRIKVGGCWEAQTATDSVNCPVKRSRGAPHGGGVSPDKSTGWMGAEGGLEPPTRGL